MTRERLHSEKKSEVAQKKERVNGRFVSTKPKEVKERLVKEEEYKITEEDRERFGSDSKAFFEWALTKAATRYEAAKYAKELLRFQYPSLTSVDSKSEVEVTTKIFRWDLGQAELLQNDESILIDDDGASESLPEPE